MAPFRTRLALALAVLPLSVLTPNRSAGQAVPTTVRTYRAELQALTGDGSWWETSNASYMTADGEGAPDAFGLRQWMGPDSISAVGCLWSIRDGQSVGIVWQFLEAWDFAERQPFYYQAHVSGTGSGNGRPVETDGDVSVVDQVFAWSDGSTQRVRHRNRWEDDDTRVTESLAWSDGEWRPNRTYIWHRRTSGTPPCGPEPR